MKRTVPRIVVVGSSNTDLVVSCDRLPRPGETLLGGAFSRSAGGKGANQAVAAARAGARVCFVGGRGDDDFGRAAAAGLSDEGIDIRRFKVIKGAASGIALILIGGRTKENVIVVADSANGRVSPQDVQAASPVIRAAGAVVAQLEIPLLTVQCAALEAAKHGIPFILNPAPARQLPLSLLRQVHTLIPNEHEAALLTGVRDVKQAAIKLLRMGCGQVVVTLGSKGALAVTREGAVRVPAPKVKPKDTVGAGDCFTAWLAVGIAQGLELVPAVRLAVKAASIAVTRPGAQAGMPNVKQVKS